MTAGRTRRTGGALTALTALIASAALTLTACSGGGSAGGTSGGQGGAPPVAPAASEFWSDPSKPVVQQVSEWRSQGRTDDAKQLEKIARQPMGVWPSSDSSKVEDETRQATSAAKAAGKTPILVAYNIPDRDCGQYSGGGASDEGDYRDWLGKFAQGMGGVHSIVILEPDALAQTLTSCEGQGVADGREQLLSEAVSTLSGAGGEVYIDAGNSGFVTDTGKLADGLRKSGVDKAAGFALNVSNFRTTQDTESYGKKISDEVGGKKFVIDTGRNGKGPYSGPEQPTWCNPPGRALGTPPTRDTNNARVAAFLWVKEPGDSDGGCRGAPDAGEFWPDYALGLAKAAPGD